MAAQPITPDPYIATAAKSLVELNGELSQAERDFAVEAKARADSDRYAQQRREQADKARAILRDELDAMPWDELIADNTRGDVAAKLYATWPTYQEAEPITETKYGAAGLRMDLTTAMALHGRPDSFREACRILGESICMAAIDYVLSCHNEDAEEAEASLRSDGARREAAREAAAEREAERRREQQLCEDRR